MGVAGPHDEVKIHLDAGFAIGRNRHGLGLGDDDFLFRLTTAVPTNQGVISIGDALHLKVTLLVRHGEIRIAQDEDITHHFLVDVAVNLHQPRILKGHVLSLALFVKPQVEAFGFGKRKNIVKNSVLGVDRTEYQQKE